MVAPMPLQHAMVMMPFALVRLMAEYARADEIDYGNMFILSNKTLFLFREPGINIGNYAYDIALENGWNARYNIESNAKY